MTDEHLMRQWADAHSDFSTSLDRGLLRLGGFLNRRFQRRQAIEKTYAQQSCAPATHEVSPTARAALAGVLACAATAALLVTVATLATSGTVVTLPAGEPIVAHAIVA